MDCFDLTGKRALVTGSSRGIGRALAEALLEAGASVVLNGVGDRLAETAKDLTVRHHNRVIPIRADMGNRADLKHFFNESVNQLGGLDIIFVNHGIQRDHAAEQFPAEDWDLGGSNPQFGDDHEHEDEEARQAPHPPHPEDVQERCPRGADRRQGCR